MENSAIIPLALTFIAGASTAIGAALTFFMRKNDFRVLALGMSFSAGVMIYISFMDIMPMSVDFISGGEGFLKGKAGIALAYAMFFVGVIAAMPAKNKGKTCGPHDCNRNQYSQFP